MATGNTSEDLRFIRVTSQSTGIIVLETCSLVGTKTVTEWILRNAAHRLFNTLHNILCQSNVNLTQHAIQPFNIKSRRSIILCSNYTAQWSWQSMLPLPVFSQPQLAGLSPGSKNPAHTTFLITRHTRCVPKDMNYIFLPLSYWSQPVLTGWLRWGGPLSS